MTEFPRPNRNEADMVWVRAPLSGAKWQVHRELAPLLDHVVTVAEQRGYLFDHGPRDVDDDWGYSVRRIGGSSTWSWHSAGAAVDIDAQQYPQGQRRKVPPGWLISLFEQWGWNWGGRWRNSDAMHFEQPDRTRAATLRAMLYASGVKDIPIPVPVGTPAPIRPARILGGPMQIIHVPDAPKEINPDTWMATDGIHYYPLQPGQPEWLVISGLVPTPNRAPDGSIRPVPMPYRFFTSLRRL